MVATPTDNDPLYEFDDSLFRAHFDKLPGPAYIWRRVGADFELIAHNLAAARVERTRISSLIGLTARALHADRPDVLADLHRCNAADEVVTRETDFRYRSEDVRRLVATHIPVGLDIVVTHVEDVTERRAAERALEESEARARALFYSNPDVTLRLDKGCRMLDMHVASGAAFPFRREQLLGRSIDDLFSPRQATELRRLVTAALGTGDTQSWEFALAMDEPAIHDIYLEARIVQSGQDEVVVWLRDVTERFRLERNLIEIGERERNRIGQDLHDGLGQILTGVKLLIGSLKERLRVAGSPLVSTAAQAAELMDTSIRQARELAQGLSPIGKGDSLRHALQQLGRQSSTFFSVNVETHVVRAPNVDETTATHLYRIAQEAVTNAVRHGRATRIDLRCETDGDRFVLCISDNGTGIGHAAPAGDGLGLRIMRHRATSIGGELEVSDGDHGGTTVTCSCPLPTGYGTGHKITRSLF